MRTLLSCVVLLPSLAFATLCEPELGEFKPSQLKPRLLDTLDGTRVTIIDQKGARIRNGILISARTVKTTTATLIYIRFLDRETNELRLLIYPRASRALRRLIVHERVAEVRAALAEADERSITAAFDPREDHNRSSLEDLDLGHPVVAVVAREGAFDLETLHGRLTLPDRARPGLWSFETKKGPRDVEDLRVITLVGRWVGF